MRIVVVSGRSGSGKSTALHVLEDVGFTCIDNLPTPLLPNLIEELHENDIPYAVSIDARNTGDQLKRFSSIIDKLRTDGHKLEIIYLDAQDDILIKRFSETRRRHPLSDPETDLVTALTLERNRLEPIISQTDLTIDTSSLNIHQLRDVVKQRVVGNQGTGMAIQFQSFGFKFGNPVDADLVFDVRCLPNPHWDLNLRVKTGADTEVIDYLREQPEVQEMLSDIEHYLERWIPRYSANNRSYLTIAIGCTGGQHRSVYLCNQLFNKFSQGYPNVQCRHREQNR